MPFCTSCGAAAEGAFCSSCGKPTSSTAQSAPPVAQNAPPPARRRRTSPLVWILVVLLGLVLIGGIAAVSGGLFLVHKAREAGVDPDLFRRNPGLAISKVIAAVDPNAEFVSSDDATGTVTLRDRRNGKQVTITSDDAMHGRFHLEAEDNGKKAVIDVGGDGANIPADVPVYPGAKVKATVQVDGDRDNGQHSAYEYEFSTPDAPARVIDYYRRKFEESGMKVALQNETHDGGMLVLEDDANRRTLRLIVSRDDGGTTINLTNRVDKADQ